MRTFILRTARMAAALIGGAAILACNNLDEIEQRLDFLESRIQALETQIPALNENVAAISALVGDGVVINSITQTENGYTITTSDGRTFNITNGAVGNTPLLRINDEGNWEVSYDGGETYEEIMVGGAPASASGTAPQFQVSADGYWQVSYDGGKTWQDVYYAGTTDKVPAVGEGSDFFYDITYDEAAGTLSITLKEGDDPIVINVVSGFECIIEGVDYASAVMFEYGQTRNFNVSIRGVAEAIVSAPAGWSAVLEGNEPTAVLTVIAPQSATGTSLMTKISADTRSDISILAVSTKGLSAITKMKVELSAEPVPANPTAVIAVAEEQTTASSLTFTVTPNADATSWKYMLLASAAEAPADEAAFAQAQEMTGTQTLTLSSTADGTPLAGNTSYTLYVLPVNTDGEEITYGAIANAAATTAMPSYDTYFEMYEAGLDITIAGKTYNKETYGEASHVTSDQTISGITSDTPDIFFVDPSATLTFNTTNAVYKLVIIGNDPDTRSRMVISSQIALNQGESNTDGTFTAYNMDMDASGVGNYLFLQNRAGAYGYVGIIDCHLKMPSGRPLTYVSTTGRSYAEFVIEDSEIEIPSANQVLLFSFGGSESNHGRIVLRNNILYSEAGVSDFRVYNGTDTTLDELVFENNTVVNLWSQTNGCALYSSLKSISVFGNLFWTNKATQNMVFFRPTDTSAGTGEPYTGNPTGTVVDNNLVYKNGESTNWQWFYGGLNRVDKTGFSACNEIIAAESDPLATANFSTGTFTPAAEYSSYGAQRD